MKTSSELLLAWSAKRTAERQPGISMSALGTCRKRAGFIITKTPPTNPSESVQAAMGQAVHEKIAEIAAELLPDDLVEYPVRFAGVPGTLDRYRAADTTLEDTKTTTSRWLEHLKLHGPDRPHIWQASGYGAALIMEGRKVSHIEIHYLARDTGEEWVYRQPFNPQDVRDALTWLETVRRTDPAMLPRDYEPDSGWCAHCPFFDACWEGAVAGRKLQSVRFVEDPDKEKWAAKLWKARQEAKEAKQTADAAAAALDALRPTEGLGRVQCGPYTLDFRSNGLYFVAGASPIPAVGYEEGDAA